MAPKPATPVGKQYDEVVVIVLLMALKASNGVSSQWYKEMSALDGVRTVSGFEHALRAANKLASELLEKKRSGEALMPEDVGRSLNGAVASATPNTPKKRKAVTENDGSAPLKKKGTPMKKSPVKAPFSAEDDLESEVKDEFI